MFAKATSLLCLMTLTLSLVAHTASECQEAIDEVIILSPEIGETIDRQERDLCRLFSASQNFPSADQTMLDAIRMNIEDIRPAQQTSEKSSLKGELQKSHKWRKWSVLVSYGQRQHNGCGPAVKKGFINGGLVATRFSGMFDPSEHPYSRAELNYFSIKVRYSLHRHWCISAFRSTGDYFDAEGLYHEHFLQPFATLGLKGHLTTYALLVDLLPSSSLHLGMGPSFHSLKVDTFGGELGNTKGPMCRRNKPGLALDFGINLPSYSRIFFDLSGQYHLADKIMIGPFDVAYDTGEPATTMPSTPVPINHWEFFIGLGIHL